MKDEKFQPIILMPMIATILTLILHIIIPRSDKILTKDLNHFRNILILVIVIFTLLIFISFFNVNIRRKLAYKSKFVTFVIILINIYNLATHKFSLIPQIYFPYPDKILNVFYVDWKFLLTCLFYSLRLFLTGAIIGGALGLLTGIAVGSSKKASYWISPLIRFVGPIPSTVWIPIALVTFPTSYAASAFIIGLSMWFPTTILTSSGIQNLERSLFEVASTLGASDLYQVKKICIPGAMPSVFVGFFNGITSSFLALMSAEMIGVKYGIGWYVNWQRETMSFANVYAALFVIAFMCSISINILFKFRDKLLVWQEGVIKW